MEEPVGNCDSKGAFKTYSIECQAAKSLSSNAAKICLTKFHLTKPLSG